MGFDWQKIPTLRHSFAVAHLPLCSFAYDDIRVRSSREELSGPLESIAADMPPFRPHFGWRQHIEEPVTS